MQGKARLAVDIGGTFTDVVLDHQGQRTTTKVLTTSDDPGRGFLAGVENLLKIATIAPGDVGVIIHGTTLATNALIERRGAKTALLTTEGHRDALEMAHENRFEQYDINIDRPAPLVPRYLRLPIRERMNKDGDVLIALDEATVHDAIATLKEHDIESVAVGFLHAYANRSHEQIVGDILAREMPDLSVTLASVVCPEIREFERFSTACANAYVRPLMQFYLNKLDRELKARGFQCPFLLFASGGGLVTLETGAAFPIRLVESGPAGGAILAKHIAEQCELDAVFSFDMGGTTAKLCMIDNYTPLTSRTFEVDRVHRFRKGSGLPVRIPVIEMMEIGAGGGSIASVDRLKRIQVGPESAGSDPGPACYGRGGKRPAVTDADLLLGKLLPDDFAGGALNLDLDAAKVAVMREVGGALDVDCDVAAFSISEVVDENMAAAAHSHAVEWGLDVASRSMIAFGGAAPLHAARLGEKLGIETIVIPTGAGVGSAIGFLLAPTAYEVVRSRHMTVSEFDTQRANALLAEMRAEALLVVRKADLDGEIEESRQVFMRYRGQGHEIAVDLPIEEFQKGRQNSINNAFETAYRKLYGRTIPGLEAEILTWTLTLKSIAPMGKIARAKPCNTQSQPSPIRSQSLFDPATAKRISAPVFERAQLSPGASINGPALITEDQTTTVVTSTYCAEVNALGYIVLKKREH